MQIQFPTASAVNGSDSDSHLITSALAGNQAAYARLVDRYQGRLTSAIRSKVTCSGLADDIVQDAFVRAFNSLHSFRSDSSFYTWLYRIAINCRRYYTKNRHRITSLDETHETCRPLGRSSCLDAVEGPLACLERREDCEAVNLAMQRLEVHHREILRLREFEGFDYRGIAEALHLTMGTVRSRISRARAQLRKELTNYWSAKPAVLPRNLVLSSTDERLSWMSV